MYQSGYQRHRTVHYLWQRCSFFDLLRPKYQWLLQRHLSRHLLFRGHTILLRRNVLTVL